MPTRALRSGRVTGIALAVVTLLLTASCSSDVAYDNSGDWARTQQQTVLDQRAKAIRSHDLALFMSTVARGDKAFVARERRYFEGITQLPLEQIRFVAMAKNWPHALVAADLPGDAVAVRVRQVIELRDFDAEPGVSVSGLVLAPSGDQWKVVADRTAGGSTFPGYTPQPWDVASVRVQRSGDVLGVFDDESVKYAGRLLPVVARAVTQDQSAFPFWWSGKVVVYCFEQPRLLDSFRRVPGGNIRDLGAMSFPVYANASGSKIAGIRFVVLPASVTAGTPYLARLVRHELTHVAVATRDDGAPTWFIEGLAEYVGARPLPRQERRIPSVAVSKASGKVGAMPSSEDFNGPDQDWHYALSWMACDYIATRFGEARLWDLMDAFHAADTTDTDDADTDEGSAGDQGQDAVLEQEIGMSSGQLAGHAAARIRRLYG